MPTALVTGGAGFIGSHLVELLLSEAWQVTVLDDLSTGDESHLAAGARFVHGSICDGEVLAGAMADADVVFHLAALPRIQPSFDDPLLHEQVNVVGAINVLVTARDRAPNVRRVVISASSSCYGTPTELPTSELAAISCLSPYAVQKYSAEQQALVLGERYGIEVVALRYFNVYGPRSFNPKNSQNAYSSVVGIFAERHKRGEPLPVTGTGAQRRDFVHVQDVARANLLAATAGRPGAVYNVGRGTTISILELAELVGGPIEHVPPRQGEAEVTWADTTKIERELGWRATISLEVGLGSLG
jgi:UDP-glucose 4-epimerase